MNYLKSFSAFSAQFPIWELNNADIRGFTQNLVLRYFIHYMSNVSDNAANKETEQGQFSHGGVYRKQASHIPNPPNLIQNIKQ